MEILASLTIADRIALTLAGLGRAVAARIAGGAMAAAMILLVWRRIRRVDGQIRGLMERYRAGTLRVLVQSEARSRVGVGRARAVSDRLPQRFGWLLPLVPYEAAGFASQLRAQLVEPEMVALLDAAPQARRVLGPLCRMLGIERALLRPRVAGEAADGLKRDRGKRVPRARVPVQPERIPLPRGVLSAARRQGFAKR